MALTSLNDIKNWFKTNFIPTQQQFWDMFDSFRHKSDKVAATDVDGLNTLLAAKASNDVFQAHLTANNAHAILFGAKVDKVAGKALSDQNYSLPEKEKLAGIYDWVNTQIAGATIGSTSLGSISPTTTIPATINVHGIAMEAGTYTNCGGVVVPANSLAFISRIGGVWTISKTAFDLSTYQKIVDGNKINPWTAKAYNSGDQVSHLGKDWVSNAVTVAGDVPGTSIIWVDRLGNKADISYVNGIKTTSFKDLASNLKAVNKRYNLIDYVVPTSSLVSKQKETSLGVWSTVVINEYDVVKPLYSGTYTNFLDVAGVAIVVPDDFNSYFLYRFSNYWVLERIVIKEDVLTQSLLNNTYLKKGVYGRYFNMSQASSAYATGNGAFYSEPLPVIEGKELIFKTYSFGSNAPITFYDINGVYLENYAPTGNANSQTLSKFVPVGAFFAIFSTLDKEIFNVKYNVPLEIEGFNFNELTKFDCVSEGLNILNPSNLIANTSINKSTGAIATSTNWWASDFIPVEVGSTYVLNTFTNYAPYNSSKVFVSGAVMSENEIIVNSASNRTITIPSGVSFIRTSAGASADANALRMIFQKLSFNRSNSGFSFDFDKNLFPHISQPLKGKKVTIVGDSYTAQGRYIYSLLTETGMTIRGLSGNSGAPLSRMPYYLTQLQTEILDSDMVIVIAGTNDYGVMSANANPTFDTIAGTINDTVRSYSTILSGGTASLSVSIVSSMRECALVVDQFNTNCKIMFVSEPERGVYAPMYDLVPPALNVNGLNMAVIAERMEFTAKTFGYNYFDFHQKAWRLSQLAKYTSDNLHPNQFGADVMGGMIARYINSEFTKFGI